MIRQIGSVAVAAAALLVSLGLPAAAAEPVADVSMLTFTAAGGALDSATLGDVSGGTLLGEPTDADAWRTDAGHAYPLDLPGVAQPAGSGIADSSGLGASMGASPPAGGSALGAGAVAGDIANTIF